MVAICKKKNKKKERKKEKTSKTFRNDLIDLFTIYIWGAGIESYSREYKIY